VKKMSTELRGRPRSQVLRLVPGKKDSSVRPQLAGPRVGVVDSLLAKKGVSVAPTRATPIAYLQELFE
jgi:hypothetical protein